MKIKKTVGVANSNNENDRGYIRKDYIVHTECGQEFLAKADGKVGYIMRGTKYKSLKEAKETIEFASEAVEAADAADDNKSPMWDCIDPCALLIRLGPPVLGHEALETLGNYGWLTEDGLPDRERVEKEFKRVLGQ